MLRAIKVTDCDLELRRDGTALTSLAPNLQAAWVYGSLAKQTDTAPSDIDVLLIGKNLLLSKEPLQCLTHTLNWPAPRWRVLDSAHQKRNAAEYKVFWKWKNPPSRNCVPW